MLFMIIKYTLGCALLLLLSNNLCAQTNSLSNSPYSVYGIGTPSRFGTGKINAIGGSGIAMKSDNSLNSLNPASLGAIPLNHFYFDLGINTQIYGLSEGAGTSKQFNATLNNVAMAFPLNSRSGLAVTLSPYANVGYSITGIENSIEGSNAIYTSDAIGTGSINEIRVDYGYGLLNNLRLGLSASYFFGKTEQTEYNTIGNYSLDIKKQNRYTGVGLNMGLQYDINESLSLASILKFPAVLKATQNSYISQDYDDTIEVETSGDDFMLPLEMGFGAAIAPRDNLKVYLDYSRKFWSNTAETDDLSTLIDQDIFKVGSTFIPKPNGIHYWQNVEYRTGFNYDTGYLEIAGEKVKSYNLSLGVGLPISHTGSKLNLSYAYGQNGSLSKGLIREKIHTISINLSLDGLWFVKPKYQ